MYYVNYIITIETIYAFMSWKSHRRRMIAYLYNFLNLLQCQLIQLTAQ